MRTLTLTILAMFLHAGTKAQPKHPAKDPVATSDNRKVDPNKTLDGSGGKYHKAKKPNRNKFLKNRRTRGVKPSERRERKRAGEEGQKGG